MFNRVLFSKASRALVPSRSQLCLLYALLLLAQCRHPLTSTGTFLHLMHRAIMTAGFAVYSGTNVFCTCWKLYFHSACFGILIGLTVRYGLLGWKIDTFKNHLSGESIKCELWLNLVVLRSLGMSMLSVIRDFLALEEVGFFCRYSCFFADLSTQSHLGPFLYI